MILPAKNKVGTQIIFGFILVVGLFFAINFPVKAASFYINPATGKIDTEKFTITISLDPEGDNVSKASAYISYDTTQIEVSTITNGTFNAYTSRFNDPTTGVIHIEASNTDELSNIVNFATIEFVNLNTSPNLNLDILTTPTYKSTILDSSGTNLLSTANGAQLTNGLYSATGGQITTSATPSAAVPDTGIGFVDYRLLIVLSTVLSVTSLYMRNHAKSEY